MADRLQSFVSYVRKCLDDDWDFVLVIDGKEGSGKSTLAFWCKAIFCGEWNLDRVVYDGHDLLELMNVAPTRSDLMIDEAKDAAFKRLFYSDMNIALAQAFGIVRSKNYFFILNIPNYWDLDPDLRTRVDYRLYCHSRVIDGVRTRGFVKAYEVVRNEWTQGKPYQELRWTYQFPPCPEDFYQTYHVFKTRNQKKKLREYQQAAKAKDRRGPTTKRDRVEAILRDDPDRDLNDIAGDVGVDITYVRRISKTVRERETT